jgi:hypothetical protein
MDPFEVLQVPFDASEDEIRRCYLELVRKHPPERDPAEFAKIREAYDQIRDPIQSVERRIFSDGRSMTFDELVARLNGDLRDQRIPTDVLLSLGDA